jgi:transcriptional regulator with XRE-family HTH domain
LGRAIRELRSRQNLTQTQVATRAGLHETDISSLESGRRNPTFQAMQRVSKGLGVRVSELMARAEEIEKREASSQRT